MPEGDAAREELLRGEYHSQTARIPWTELQAHFARGNVIDVAAELDLVDVAVQLGMDNTRAFQDWIDNGAVSPVSEEQALRWFESGAVLWAVVAAPWVLVQEPGRD